MAVALLCAVGTWAQSPGDDMTSYITNPGFTGNADGWTITGQARYYNKGTGFDGTERFVELCKWDGSWDATISQTVTSLPNGYYKVQAAGQMSGATDTWMKLVANGVENQFSRNGDTNGNILTDGTETTVGGDGAQAGWRYTRVIAKVTDGTLAISVVGHSDIKERWANVDAFTLTYLGTILPDDTDLTPYIVNHSFETRDLTGWTKSGTSTDTGVCTPDGSHATTGADGNFIFNTWWQGVALTQEITNPPTGLYTLKASLASSDDDADAKLFLLAGGNHSDVITITQGTKGQFNDYTYDFSVDDGNTTIGVVGGNADGSYNASGHWWYKADNFRLIYRGARLSDAAGTLPDGSAVTSATWYKVSIASNADYFVHSSVAATISYTTDGSQAVSSATGTDATFSAGETKVISFTEGTLYIKADAATTILIIAKVDGANVTDAFITNPSFENNSDEGWTFSRSPIGGSIKSDGNLSNKVGTYYQQVSNNYTGWNVRQTMSSVPVGKYILSVNSKTSNATTAFNLKMGDKSTPTCLQADAATYYVAYEVEEAEDVIIGFDANATGGSGNNSYWRYDNFTLTYYSTLPDVSISSLTSEAMAADVRAALDAANTAYTSGKTVANYNALQTAIVNAKTSIAAFAANTGDDADWTGIIQNPSFENWDGSNPIGWTQVAVGNGDIKKEGGIGEDSGSYRFYIWSATAGAGYVKQTIKNLPAGNYKLSAYMFSEAGDALTLTAGSISGSVLASDGSANLIEVYFTQVSDGDVEISAKHSNTWFNIDNFHLTLNPTLPAEISGVSGKMKASVSTAQTTAINAYNAVDGQTFANMLTAQAAKEEAIKSIKIYNNIATIRSNYATKAGALDDDGQDAYDTAINIASTGAETKYEAGDYETAAQAEEAYHSDYVTAVKAQTTENTDMTEAIVNPSFESDLSTGWSTGDMGRQNNTAFDKKSGTYYVERYHVAGEKYIKQTLTGFHSGVYTLTAAAYATNSTSPKLYVKVGGTESFTTVTDSKDYSVSFNYDDSETLEIGFSATLTSDGWVCVDNFRLTYDDDALPTSLDEVTGYMNADVKTAANTAIAAYNSDKTIANYSAAQAAITDAEASRAVYVTINDTKTTYQGKADALDPAGQAAYTTAVNAEDPDGAATKYENGTYVTALEAELAFMADLATASKAQATAGADMTGAIINNSFETGTTDGWTYTTSNDHGAKLNSNNTYKMSNVDGSYLFNIWSTGYPISQILTDMPAGTYRLTAVMGTDAGATLNVKLGDATGSASSVDKGTGVVVSVEKTLATAGNLTVEADAGGSHWYKVDNFRLTYLGVQKNVTVSAKAGKFGTVILPFAYDFAADEDFSHIEFYSCGSVTGSHLELEEVTTPAANTPYIIKNNGESNISLAISGYSDAALNDSYTAGNLTGVYTEATIAASDELNSRYVLQTEGDVQAFYKVVEDFIATPYKCYLTVPTALGVKAFSLDIEDAIQSVEVIRSENAEIFNLAGQKMNKLQKGVNIVNGKKVLVK